MQLGMGAAQEVSAAQENGCSSRSGEWDVSLVIGRSSGNFMNLREKGVAQGLGTHVDEGKGCSSGIGYTCR